MKSLRPADIEIAGKVSAIRPWSVQHKGCGERGVAVRIAENFFSSNDENFDSKIKGMEADNED